ncbi:hypothetical protein Tco_0955253 [Tanacetum coccineum]|uniref:Uncharacterized protein n=1 Tax=Tanacetum coccineum TaxID=301880 RepID=A0ABQ5E6T0_9ASTR
MAQHVLPAAQLVPQYKSIGRCNNYAMLQRIPCSPECKIVGLILLDHCLSHAQTATADVPAVYLQQFWRTMSKKFPNISKRIDEDYHSIKDDIPLNSETDDFKKSPIVSASLPVSKKRKQIVGESSSPRKSLKITIKQKQIVEKDDADFEDRIEPKSHKDNPEVVDDDDDKERETKDDEMGSLEIRNEETQTTIPTPLSSPRKILSSDKKTSQELTDIVSTTTTSKHSQVKKRISSKYSHTLGALRKMCRHQVNTIIEDRDAFRSQVLDFVFKEFKAHAPASIAELFKNHVQSNVIHAHPTTTTSTETESSADLQYQLYLKMKRNLQDRADDIALWEALRHKFKKTFTSNTSCREDNFHSHHNEHQDDDAPPEEEKRVKRSKTTKRTKSARGSTSKHSRKDSKTYVSKQQSQHQEWDAWEEENVVDEDENMPTHLEQSTNFMENQIVWESRQPDILRTIPKTLIFYGPQRNPNEPPRPLYNKDLFFLKYGNTKEKKYILSLHKIHAEEFPEPDLEEKVYKQNQKKVRKNPKDYYSNHKITEVVRIVTDQPHGLDFMEKILVMKSNDKPDSFSEADFKYLNKNDIEDLYYLCRSKEIDNRKVKLMNSLIMFIRSCVIWERVYDFQLGIESYQMKVYLTAPTLTFPVMYLEEIVKFCDATLEKVLNEVKLRMFESKFLKKPPLLGELDQDIMKAYEREISKRLSHRQQMQR